MKKKSINGRRVSEAKLWLFFFQLNGLELLLKTAFNRRVNTIIIILSRAIYVY